ncbi:MAG: VOC family protein [Chloroflexi bacterium]|jgi:hypothetical protein|nr:VOC family protein [Chloroflexota bacterium]MBT5319786.1 VOC family protein [Chloroflexota bacterium]
MTLQLRAVTIDALDPVVLGQFWSAVTGREIIASRSDLVRLASETTDGPVLLFLKVPESKSGKDRIHLDLETDDRASEVKRIMALGATYHSEVEETKHAWTVLQDPEGNEFCIIESIS